MGFEFLVISICFWVGLEFRHYMIHCANREDHPHWLTLAPYSTSKRTRHFFLVGRAQEGAKSWCFIQFFLARCFEILEKETGGGAPQSIPSSVSAFSLQHYYDIAPPPTALLLQHHNSTAPQHHHFTALHSHNIATFSRLYNLIVTASPGLQGEQNKRMYIDRPCIY